MGETTLQDRRGSTNRQATKTYTDLKDAALAFVNAQNHRHDMASKMDLAALKGCVAPSFSHTFGPNCTVSQAPRLQGAFTLDSFIEHLGSMTPAFETWDIQIKGVVVDEVAQSAVVRASYRMQVKDASEVVENDVVWWLELEERLSGSETGKSNTGGGRGGWTVRRSTEMVDAAAAGRIKELMMQRPSTGTERKDSAAIAE